MPESIQEPEQNMCRRCGNCCMSGPPALHGEDTELYTKGVVRKADLLTLRSGETVYDNVQGRRQVLDGEMVRIRSLPGDTACVLYARSQHACSIYQSRPRECRLFACWDTRDLVQAYTHNRVQRLDLISPQSALGRIIAEHEHLCPWSRVQALLPEVAAEPRGAAARELAEILHVDRAMRAGLQDKGAVSDPELEFLFGRPMQQTLPGLGLTARRTRQGYVFSV